MPIEGKALGGLTLTAHGNDARPLTDSRKLDKQSMLPKKAFRVLTNNQCAPQFRGDSGRRRDLDLEVGVRPQRNRYHCEHLAGSLDTYLEYGA